MIALLLIVARGAAHPSCALACDSSLKSCHVANLTCYSQGDVFWAFSTVSLVNSSLYFFSNSTDDAFSASSWTVNANELSLVNSTVFASNASIHVNTLHIDALSNLSANGTGAYENLSRSPTNSISCGSYAGFGGGYCDRAEEVGSRGSQWFPSEFGSGVHYPSGGDSPASNAARGGGVILIKAKAISLKGQISAAGNRPLNDSVFGTSDLTEQISYSGSGGSVLIFGNFTERSGFITVAGGSVSDFSTGICGGGGGRAALHASSRAPKVITRGGVGGRSACSNGGAGTFFDSIANSIKADNGDIATESLTILNFTSNLTVSITRGALVSDLSPALKIDLINLHLSSSTLRPCYDYMTFSRCSMTLTARHNVTIAKSGTFGSTRTSSIWLHVGSELIVDTSSSIVYVNNATINASSFFMEGEILSFLSETSSSNIQIYSKLFILEPQGQAKARHIGIVGDEVVVHGILQTQMPTCNDVGSVKSPFVCFDVMGGNRVEQDLTELLHSTSYSLYIEAKYNFTLHDSAKVIGARLGICAGHMEIFGLISSSSFGCPSGKGAGAGRSSQYCTGTGGGYGGNGGWGKSAYQSRESDCTEVLPGQQYSDATTPWYEGSGGGSQMMLGGSGGGFIMLAAYKAIINSGKVTSDGGSAISNTGVFSGGGAGGSILIVTSLLAGEGEFSANGGLATESGGGGSGGRIFFNWVNTSQAGFFSDPYTNHSWVGSISASGSGANSTDSNYVFRSLGQDGSMAASSCPAGFAGVTCNECPEGMYKQGTGWAKECTECTNKPPSAYYSRQGFPDPDCPYKCPDDYRSSDVNPDCRSPLEEFVHLMGGWQVSTVGFGIYVAYALLWLTFVLCIHAKRRSRVNGSLLDKPLKQITHPEVSIPVPSKKQVCGLMSVPDLPFHIRRLYLLGHNSYISPWALALEPDPEVVDLVFPDTYSQFAQAINQHTHWRRWEHWVELCLQVVYFPLSCVWKRYRRRLKANKLLLFIQQFNEIIWRKIESRHLGNSLRLTISDCCTLACIDIVSNTHYNAKKLLYKRKTTLLAAGTGGFFTPFRIDKTDCLVQLLGYTVGASVLELDLYLDSINAVLFRLTPADILENTKVVNQLRKLVRKLNSEVLEFKGLHASLCVFQAAQSIFQGEFKPSRYTTELIDSPLETELTSLSRVSYILKPGLLLTPVNLKDLQVVHIKEIEGVSFVWELYNLDFDIPPATLKALFELKVTTEIKWTDPKLFDFNRKLFKLKARGTEIYCVGLLTVLSSIDAVRNTQAITTLTLSVLIGYRDLKGCLLFFFILPGAPFIVVLFGTLVVFFPKGLQMYIAFVAISLANIVVTLIYELRKGYPLLWFGMFLASGVVKILIITASAHLSSHTRKIPIKHARDFTSDSSSSYFQMTHSPIKELKEFK